MEVLDTCEVEARPVVGCAKLLLLVKISKWIGPDTHEDAKERPQITFANQRQQLELPRMPQLGMGQKRRV
jgi:hypothetical protein